MFQSGDGKILMQYRNVKTSTADFTGGFVTLIKHEKGVTYFFVDNLKGKKDWLIWSEAKKVSPALHQTMIDKYVARYKKGEIATSEKELYKANMFSLFTERSRA